MKKIISLFKRDYEGNRQVYNEIIEGAEWVINGEGVATVKWDGTCCMVRDGQLFKRYTIKQGRMAPDGFDPATEIDPNTGKQEGWVPVGEGKEDRWHNEAFLTGPLPDGTYELVGPKVQGNPYNFDQHKLVLHGSEVLTDQPEMTFEAIKFFLEGHPIEGIVWHHPDGRMVKIKRRDFGFKWPY